MVTPAAAYGAALDAQAATRNAILRPVGCNTNYPFGISTLMGITAGWQFMGKSVHWFPAGGTNIKLLIVGGGQAGATESANAQGFPLKLSCCVDYQLWSPAKAYAVGDTVVWYPSTSGINSGRSQQNPYYTCVTANSGSAPGPSNAKWTPALRPVTYPVTFDGVQDASFATQTLPDGTTATRGQRWSDVLPVTVPVGARLAVWAWSPMSGSQTIPLQAHAQALFTGATFRAAASGVADLTAAPTFMSGTENPPASSANNIAWSPAGIVGLPITPVKSAVIIGDSITAAVAGSANLASIALAAAGAGYVVGDILTLGRNGATAGAVAAGGDAQIYVDAIGTSGALSSWHVINTGCYTNTATQTGQVLPTSGVVSTGGTGSGATCNATFGTAPYDLGDMTTGAMGWLARGLSSLGIPHSTFAAAGDRLNLWTTNAARRLGAIGALNADIAVVALGRNDFTQPDTLANYQANVRIFVAALKGLGIKKVYGCTTTPEVTSTTANGTSTLTDQVVTANDPVRQAANAWLRSGASPFDAIIDVCALVENGGATAPTGKWQVYQGQPIAADGKHPGLYAHALMAGAITASGALFM